MTARTIGTGDTAAGQLPRVSDDRRRTERVESVIRATVRSRVLDTTPARARAVDISEHGARLLLRRQFELGERIDLDLECELPLRVHMGFDAQSLVVDGPMHTHLVRLEAKVVRCTRTDSRMFEVGVEYFTDAAWQDLQVVSSYVDHLREAEIWI